MCVCRCLKRLLENWDPLKVFFKEEVDKLKKGRSSAYAVSKAESIFAFLRSPTNQLYSLFLLFVVRSLEPFLLTLQSEEPKIHVLGRHIQRLLKQLMMKFTKPQAMPFGMPVEDVDYKTSANLKADADLSIGEEALQFITDKELHHLRDIKIVEFFTRVKSYYTHRACELPEVLHATDAARSPYL